MVFREKDMERQAFKMLTGYVVRKYIMSLSPVFILSLNTFHSSFWNSWLGQVNEMLPRATEWSEVNWPIWESNPQLALITIQLSSVGNIT